MSLAAGPGIGGSRQGSLPEKLVLHVDKHVRYVQTLDTVRGLCIFFSLCLAAAAGCSSSGGGNRSRHYSLHEGLAPPSQTVVSVGSLSLPGYSLYPVGLWLTRITPAQG